MYTSHAIGDSALLRQRDNTLECRFGPGYSLFIILMLYSLKVCKLSIVRVNSSINIENIGIGRKK